MSTRKPRHRRKKHIGSGTGNTIPSLGNTHSPTTTTTMRSSPPPPSPSPSPHSPPSSIRKKTVRMDESAEKTCPEGLNRVPHPIHIKSYLMSYLSIKDPKNTFGCTNNTYPKYTNKSSYCCSSTPPTDQELFDHVNDALHDAILHISPEGFYLTYKTIYFLIHAREHFLRNIPSIVDHRLEGENVMEHIYRWTRAYFSTKTIRDIHSRKINDVMNFMQACKNDQVILDCVNQLLLNTSYEEPTLLNNVHKINIKSFFMLRLAIMSRQSTYTRRLNDTFPGASEWFKRLFSVSSSSSSSASSSASSSVNPEYSDAHLTFIPPENMDASTSRRGVLLKHSLKHIRNTGQKGGYYRRRHRTLRR